MNKVVTAGFDYSPYSQRFVKASKDRAKEIRDYDVAAGANIIAMGGLLKKQRDAFGSVVNRKQARGTDTWTSWLQAELGWHSRSHANRVIQVYERFDGVGPTPSMTYDMMRLLAAKSTPQQLVDEVLELAKQGKLPKVKKVAATKKKMMDPNPLLTPTEAKKLAKADGAAVMASDGRYYKPMDEQDIEAYEERRARTFAAHDAIEAINGIGLTPGELLAEAEPRWLGLLELGKIEAAGSWLEQLRKDFKVRQRIIDNEADTIEKICRIS